MLMERRQFLKKVGAQTGAGISVGLAGAACISDKVVDCAGEGLELVNGELAALRKEFEKMELSYRTVLRAVLITASISTGIDVATWL
jgi:hypothetical protein